MDKNLGLIISKYRAIHGMSMDDFAKKSGLSKAYISMLENNKNPRTGKPIAPSLETYIAVANATGQTVEKILIESGSDSMVNLGINKSGNIFNISENNKQILFKDENFTLISPTRVIKPNAEDFLSSSLYSMTEEREAGEERPSREEILIWLRDHVRMAAFDGQNYEDRDDESLYRLYKELKDEAERD